MDRRAAGASKQQDRFGRTAAPARAVMSQTFLWSAAVFLATFLVTAAVNWQVIKHIPASGDEPWYLLLGYSLLHNHTANLALVLHNPSIYHAFLGGSPDDHTADVLGNGERVLPYVPGYSAIIAPFYALYGRRGVVLFQAALMALALTLVFEEGRRLFKSRSVGVFSVLAFVCALPPLLYVGQIFPSSVAAPLKLIGFVLIVRYLPSARGWRLVAAAVSLGLCIAFLPWLHFKYLFVSIAMLGLACYALWPRLRASGRDRTARDAVYVAGILGTLMAASLVLLVAFSRHNFGTLTPQVNFNLTSQVDLLHPDVPRALWLYADMLTSRQSGLLTWAPLYFLVPFGVAIIWRRAKLEGIGIAVMLISQLGTFASALFSALWQGYAFPGRFAVDSAPFFALCVGAVFGWALPAVRSFGDALLWPSALRQRFRPGRASLAATRRSRAARHTGLRLALGTLTVLLTAVSAWFTRIGLHDPYLLYPGHGGPRLVQKYPRYLPGWWFYAFPETPYSAEPYDYRASGTLSFPYAQVIARSSQLEDLTDWWDVPPGSYAAQFSLVCGSTGTGGGKVELVVERQVGDYPDHTHAIRIADRMLPADTCTGIPHTVRVTVPFGSLGYERTGFRVFYAGASAVYDPQVTYVLAGK